MALRVLSEKLAKAPQTTKLLISLSDGQPKAMPDYSGKLAVEDMKQIIRFSHLEKLTQEAVEIFIKRVILYRDKRVEIVWNFAEADSNGLTGTDKKQLDTNLT